jgi:di/tricarboxylate transporter
MPGRACLCRWLLPRRWGKFIADRLTRQSDRAVGAGAGWSTLRFFEYAKLGIPMLACGILYFVTIGYRILPKTNAAQPQSVNNIKARRCPKYKQVIALSVLILTVLGMIFEKQLGLPIAIVGSIGALSLIVTRVITEKQAYQAIDSQTIFLFGGTLALAKALETTGAGAIMARSIIDCSATRPRLSYF